MKSQGGEGEDPDSRMDSERTDRRDKKGGKTKVGIILTTLDGFLCKEPIKSLNTSGSARLLQ